MFQSIKREVAGLIIYGPLRWIYRYDSLTLVHHSTNRDRSSLPESRTRPNVGGINELLDSKPTLNVAQVNSF